MSANHTMVAAAVREIVDIREETIEKVITDTSLTTVVGRSAVNQVLLGVLRQLDSRWRLRRIRPLASPQSE